MSTQDAQAVQDAIDQQAQAIADHKQQCKRTVERIRGDDTMTAEERRAALTREHTRATTRHTELVTQLRALVERRDGEEGDQPAPKDMNELLRAERDALHFAFGDRQRWLADQFLVSPPERPQEVPAR